MVEAQALAWCSQFPTSTSLDDLISPFRENCKSFIQYLEGAGATVSVAATYRPPERAYLMHYCCMIAGGPNMDPAAVPPFPGVGIQWDLGSAELSVGAAKAMMKGYGIAYPAALVSRHTQRRAIDMTINGFALSGQALWDLGKTYGLIKLVSDPPHWSDDGH